MISVKYALVIVAAFLAGSFFTPPVQQALAAVIATDVQCTGCVGAADLASSAVTTTKLASNSVNGGKISDGTISAADLGPNSVRASEIKGVSKLIFASCTLTFPDNTFSAGGYPCKVTGARPGDQVVATLHSNGSCSQSPLLFSTVIVNNDQVSLIMQNNSQCPNHITSVQASIIVYS